MSTSVICPDCDARFMLRTAPVAGTRLKCPKCSTRFAYIDPSDLETSAAKKPSRSASKTSAIRADSPARGRSAARSDEPDEEEEERNPRKKKKAKAGSKIGLIIGLAVGAMGIFFLVIVAVVVGFFVLREGPREAQKLAKGNDPAVAVPPVKDQGGKDAKQNDPPPVAPPKQNDPPPVAPPKQVNLGELYGDQGGEPVAAADPGLPSTLMRARRDDTFFKLSNPREGEIKGPDAKGQGNSTVRQALLIDYVVVRRGKLDGGVLIIHTEDGRRTEVALNLLAGRDQGTIELVGVTNFGGKFGFGKKTQVNSKTQFPKNAEFYVTRGDDRYRPPVKFMVSNAVVMGEIKVTSRARDWTAEEIDNYTKGPLAYLTPNAHPTVGEDVPALNSGQTRYVDPDGRLVGLDYLANQWGDKKRIWRLTPIFSHDQPQTHSRELARPGYAVAGAEVNVDKDNYISGIRLLFRRLKSDNTLDAADAYAGEWIGTAPADAPTVLANDGRRVIGIRFQSGAIVDRFALVVAR